MNTTGTRIPRNSHFGIEIPAAEGTTVQQGHADYCESYGHAFWVVDGVDKGLCPRCGVVTESPADRGFRAGFVGTDRGTNTVRYFLDVTIAAAHSNDFVQCWIPAGADVVTERPFVDPLGRTPGDIIILARDIDIAAGPELYVAGTEFLVLEVLPPVRPFGPTRTSATYRVRAILPSRVLAEREHTLSAVLFQTN